MGCLVKGASTDIDYVSGPRVDNGPSLERDPRYPDRVQTGLSARTRDNEKDWHSPNFLVSSKGFVSPVPNGAVGPKMTKGSGVMFTGGSGGHGFDPRTATVRVMDANPNQGPRTNFENNLGQIVDPFTGMTSHKKGHFSHDRS